MEVFFLISIYSAAIFLVTLGPIVMFFIKSEKVRSFCNNRDISPTLFFFVVIHSTLVFCILISTIFVFVIV